MVIHKLEITIVVHLVLVAMVHKLGSRRFMGELILVLELDIRQQVLVVIVIKELHIIQYHTSSCIS